MSPESNIAMSYTDLRLNIVIQAHECIMEEGCHEIT